MNLKIKAIKIGYIGLSHLGINTAVTTAELGYDVICYDQNIKVIQELKNNSHALKEPFLSELILKNKNRLNFTNELKNLNKCNIVYVSQDIRTNNKNKSDIKSILRLVNKIIKYINKQCLLVIYNQVPPGFTRKIKWPKNQLFYQVETLIFGKAIKRALKPERIILGCLRPNNKINKTLNHYLNSYKAPIIKMSYESAELTKISINLFLISSVIVTNKLSEVSEKIGAKWFDIIPALQLDKRIGKYSYIKPGLGISGGNLERDLENIINITKKYNLDDNLFKIWFKESNNRKNWIFNHLKKLVFKKIKNPNICILGLTYKVNTNSTKNSTSIEIIKKLKNITLSVYDPFAKYNNNNITRYNSSIDAMKKSDVLIVMTPWPEFKKITIKELKNNMRGRIILDPYRVLIEKKLNDKGFKYITLN